MFSVVAKTDLLILLVLSVHMSLSKVVSDNHTDFTTAKSDWIYRENLCDECIEECANYIFRRFHGQYNLLGCDRFFEAGYVMVTIYDKFVYVCNYCYEKGDTSKKREKDAPGAGGKLIYDKSIFDFVRMDSKGKAKPVMGKVVISKFLKYYFF